MFDLLLKYAVSEDGRLHSEKYYATVRQEFQTTRPAFRWRQLVALARVTASMYGFLQQDKKEGRAPGERRVGLRRVRLGRSLSWSYGSYRTHRTYNVGHAYPADRRLPR